MRIVADPDRCVGAGQCVLAAPAVFDQSEDDGTVALLAERPGEASLAAVRQAVMNCPSGAIALSPD